MLSLWTFYTERIRLSNLLSPSAIQELETQAQERERYPFPGCWCGCQLLLYSTAGTSIQILIVSSSGEEYQGVHAWLQNTLEGIWSNQFRSIKGPSTSWIFHENRPIGGATEGQLRTAWGPRTATTKARSPELYPIQIGIVRENLCWKLQTCKKQRFRNTCTTCQRQEEQRQNNRADTAPNPPALIKVTAQSRVTAHPRNCNTLHHVQVTQEEEHKNSQTCTFKLFTFV